MSACIRTIVVDDHPLYRGGVIQTLDAEPDIEVVGEGADADAAVRLMEKYDAEVALLDISMPGDGRVAVKRIRSQFPKARLAILTASEADDDVSVSLQNGADGYILKGVGGVELSSIVRSLANGESYVSPRLAARLLSANSKGKKDSPEDLLASLTKREADVLRLVASGLTNKETASALDLQEKTVKHYMTCVLQKLAARNRVEAVILAREHWVDFD